MKVYKLLILVLLLFGCSNDNDFERKSELIDYLNKVHNIDISSYSNSIVFIISGNCGSCNIETINLINQFCTDTRFKSFKKYVLVPKENLNSFEKFDDIISSKINIIKDKNIQMIRYGILFSKNVFLEMRHSHIIYWNWLYLQSIYEVKKHYF